ncbi:MAG: hypothetical protein GY749_19700, partial [Desulfobacteraceae bacterium]|nr:hypothetical protein [Desulfobacteraceae bacterium]
MRPFIKFEKTQVSFHSKAARINNESMPISDKDTERCNNWIDSYRNALESKDKADTLLNIGREMYNWLNGEAGIMDRLVNEETGNPLIVDFIGTGGRRTQGTLRFLQAPWELLADEQGHLAAGTDLKFCPVRRINDPENETEPSQYRLCTVFMAAEPRDTKNPLSYEDEESS